MHWLVQKKQEVPCTPFFSFGQFGKNSVDLTLTAFHKHGKIFDKFYHSFWLIPPLLPYQGGAFYVRLIEIPECELLRKYAGTYYDGNLQLCLLFAWCSTNFTLSDPKGERSAPLGPKSSGFYRVNNDD